MKAIVDVCYRSDRATAACVVFNHWTDPAPGALVRTDVPVAAAYRPGRFYERELPCILAVLQQAAHEFEVIVIDGYVHLQAQAGKGLGAHLHDALACAPVVVGVAKTPLKIAQGFLPVYRGRSRKPLLVSAVGCYVQEAAAHIEMMHGPFRLPTLLKLADGAARRAYAEALYRSEPR